jgi:hypothetical protein
MRDADGDADLEVRTGPKGAVGREPPRRRPRPGAAGERGWSRWLGEPRAAVLLVLFLIVLIGGGRKLLRGWRGRGAIGRLGAPDVTVDDVAAALEFGRAGLMDLFQILGTAESAALRRAAGHALSVLWARDELIAEEEQALVRRGFEVTWHARRRYPRALRDAIPMAVSYSLPFLRADGGGIAPKNLEWSHTILGARRALLEVASPWQAGPGRADFALVPEDFATNGPHRLVLKTRVRTAGLTGPWELELPQMPWSFEFDPNLSVDALFTLPDTARGEAFSSAVRLVASEPGERRGAAFLDLNTDMALRNPPEVTVSLPLPCDLAHTVALEIEGIPGRFVAGEVILSGQGLRGAASESVRSFALEPTAPATLERLDRPGPYRIRAVLEPDAERGWADPDIRSIWPEPIVTDWVEVEVVRR